MTWPFITIPLTTFVAILIPVYWRQYGPTNFLWLSDVGLFLTVIALWTESTFLMSLAAVLVLVVESIWNVAFFIQLFSGIIIVHLADYMFDTTYPLYLRCLSLFHVSAPVIWITYLAQFGYEIRVLTYAIILYWVLILLTYFFTKPKDNINWAFAPTKLGYSSSYNRLWIIGLMICFPLCIIVPSHLVYKTIFTQISAKYQDNR